MTRAAAACWATAVMLLWAPDTRAGQHPNPPNPARGHPPAATGSPHEEGPGCRPRSPWLRPMLTAQAALQAAWAHGTRRVMRAGGREANPLMRWAAAGDARAYGVKALAVAASWWLTERISCRHPEAAFWIATALNVLLALVAGRNYHIAGKVAAGP
ncbi:MAG: hypothetical protein OXG35_17695 [Acidobacteria bacterium]|nr:hypothetical protein [Acidobacteriota bacterium]